MQNGYFQLVNAPGGYGLQIFQPKDGGADVNLQEVLNYLERESVPYDPMAIKKAILSGGRYGMLSGEKGLPGTGRNLQYRGQPG